MDEEEMRGILEDLARNGPPSAQVAAIRVLPKLDLEEPDEEEPRTAFDDLYDLTAMDR
jgi:hypothetical protein